ncbi:hypothetical protein AWC38_SpisGene12567 [Stylophora pistillata]|uniref:Uncharacterized protein n=1 Tax=Stylophora pistillata TaxID=50429 RepID=A0A2B4S1J4_STYPI|nr:hypothetical protein AWC38_SpisGene12567 [Stylophora pistillata]
MSEEICDCNRCGDSEIEEDENNSSSTLSAVAAVVVAAILAPKVSNLAPEDLVLSPELSIHDAINEGVDGATQIGQERVRQIGEDENNSSSSLSAVAAVVVAAILAPKVSNLAQEDLVLSPELSIHDAINEGVDGATQIDQERVRQVSLSWLKFEAVFALKEKRGQRSSERHPPNNDHVYEHSLLLKQKEIPLWFYNAEESVDRNHTHGNHGDTSKSQCCKTLEETKSFAKHPPAVEQSVNCKRHTPGWKSNVPPSKKIGGTDPVRARNQTVTPELSIHDAINEGVDGATQIN